MSYPKISIPNPSTVMVQQLPAETVSEIIYPDRDGEPMADNTKQFRWIVTIKENLEILFASILPKLNRNGSVQRKRSPNLNKNDSVIKLCYNKYSSKP
jgi:hypothetical protein